MKRQRTAERYAKALLGLARDAREAAAFDADLQAFGACWRESAALRQVCRNPAVGRVRQLRVLQSLVARLELSAAVAATLTVVMKQRHLDALEAIIAAFSRMRAAAHGQLHAQVATATALQPEFYSALEQLLAKASGKQVMLTQIVDPTLLGGVRTQVGDLLLDGSLKRQLERLQETLASQTHSES